MFRTIQSMVVALCAALVVCGFSVETPSVAQTFDQQSYGQLTNNQYPPSSAATQQSYYHRPDRSLEPDEFLARAKQSNADSVLQKYEQLLKQNRNRPVNPALAPGQKRYIIEQIPAQLVPPGAPARQAGARAPAARPYPVAGSNRPVTPSQKVARQTPKEKPLAQPGFSLSTPQKQNRNTGVARQAATPTNWVRRASNAPRTSQQRPQTASRQSQLQSRQQSNVRPGQSAALLISRMKKSSASRVSDYPSDQSRARIVSFHQDVPSQDQAPGRDPFDDPPSDMARPGANRQENPFADPPADILQNNQLTDPFENPPADIQRNPPTQETLEGNPSTQREPEQPLDVDRFPDTPGDLDPRTPDGLPEDPIDPGTAPGRSPDREPRQEPDPDPIPRDSSSYRTGPYESFNGYQPTPILPAPPDREFPGYTQPQIMPNYQFGPNGQVDNQLSQPTLFHDNFETSQLYQGITHDGDTQLATYECEACNGNGAVDNNRSRIPMFDGLRQRFNRLTRIGRYDYQTCDTGVCDPGFNNTNFNGPVSIGLGLGMGIGRSSQLRQTNQTFQTCQTCQPLNSPVFGGGQTNYYESYVDSCNACPAPIQQSVASSGFATNSGCCCDPMFYFSLFGGYTSGDDFNDLGLSPVGTSVPNTSGSLFGDSGYGLGIAIGQLQGRNLRSEIEYTFRSSDPDFVRSQLVSSTNQSFDGSLDSHAGLFNLYWDFNRHLFWFRPYVGAGVGFAFFDYDVSDASGEVGGNDSTFAYQWMAGVSRSCSSNSEWFVEYRQFFGDSIDIDISEFSDSRRYRSENIFFGFRKRF